MKTCKYCQSEISKKAKICPNCRKKQNKFPTWLRIVLGLLVVIIGLSALTGNNETNTNGSKKEKFTVIEGTEKGYADEMNMFYYIEGTVKNNTDKTYDYLQVTYNVYDKDDNNLGTCLANNNNIEANGTWKFKAVCSGTAEDITNYKLAEITGW